MQDWFVCVFIHLINRTLVTEYMYCLVLYVVNVKLRPGSFLWYILQMCQGKRIIFLFFLQFLFMSKARQLQLGTTYRNANNKMFHRSSCGQISCPWLLICLFPCTHVTSPLQLTVLWIPVFFRHFFFPPPSPGFGSIFYRYFPSFIHSYYDQNENCLHS